MGMGDVRDLLLGACRVNANGSVVHQMGNVGGVAPHAPNSGLYDIQLGPNGADQNECDPSLCVIDTNLGGSAQIVNWNPNDLVITVATSAGGQPADRGFYFALRRYGV